MLCRLRFRKLVTARKANTLLNHLESLEIITWWERLQTLPQLLLCNNTMMGIADLSLHHLNWNVSLTLSCFLFRAKSRIKMCYNTECVGMAKTYSFLSQALEVCGRRNWLSFLFHKIRLTCSLYILPVFRSLAQIMHSKPKSRRCFTKHTRVKNFDTKATEGNRVKISKIYIQNLAPKYFKITQLVHQHACM